MSYKSFLTGASREEVAASFGLIFETYTECHLTIRLLLALMFIIGIFQPAWANKIVTQAVEEYIAEGTPTQ